MAEQLDRVARRRLRAREVPRHVPRAGARSDRAQGRGRRDRGAAPAATAPEGRRPHGRARGQREGGQGGARAASRRPDVEAERAREAGGRRSQGATRKRQAAERATLHAVPNADRSRSADGALAHQPRQGAVPGGRLHQGQVIDYYARIAPVMLPHLAGRALTFRRFPNGVDEQVVLREALPLAPSRLGARRRRPGRPRRRDRLLRASTSRPRSCGRPTSPRSSSTRRWRCAGRPRHADAWSCSTSIPARRPPSSSAAQVALDDPRRARRTSVCDVFAKTSGRRGCSSTCRSTPPHTHDQASSFALAVGQLLEKQHPTGCVTRWPRPCGRTRCSSTGARTTGTRRRSRRTRCGLGRARPCRRRSTWDEVLRRRR